MKSWIVAVALSATFSLIIGCGGSEESSDGCPPGTTPTEVAGQSGCSVPIDFTCPAGTSLTAIGDQAACVAASPEAAAALTCPEGTILTPVDGQNVCLGVAGTGASVAGAGGVPAPETTGGGTAEGAETAAEENAGGETAGSDEEGGETAAAEGEDSENDGATGGGAAGGGEEEGPSKEDCINGADDDGNGLVDCEDPQCQGKPACLEADCGDGVDNDANGLVDCDDDACMYSDACMEESCNSWYLCLGEQGGDCELGVDCPDANSDEFGSFMQACAQNETCNNACVQALSIPVQEQLSAFQNCQQTFCAQATGDAYSECITTNCITEYIDCFYPEDKKQICKDYYTCTDTNECFADEKSDEETTDCVFGQCLEQFANCNYGGEGGCSEYQACAQEKNCNANMTDDEYYDCILPCREELSPAGFIDLLDFETCRVDLCDANDDNEYDSDACVFAAYFGACLDEAGTCLDTAQFTGEGTCSDVADCYAECEDFSTALDVEGAQPGQEITCDVVCIEQVNPATSAELGAMFTCFIQTCGTTEEEFTPACIAEALAEGGACAAEYAACQ